MTRQEFLLIYQRFTDSLAAYVAAANKLCELLLTCGEEPLSVEQRSEIGLYRSQENAAHAQYSEYRLKLLEYAKLGYGDDFTPSHE